MFCENCGVKLPADANACEECGFIIRPLPEEGVNETNQEKPAIISTFFKNNMKKIVIVGGGFVALVIAFFIFTSVLSIGGSREAPLVYYSRDGLFAIDKGAKAPYLLSENAAYEINDAYYTYGNYYITNDGKRIFYADGKRGDNTKFDIYVRELKDKKSSGKGDDEKGIKVASNVDLHYGKYFSVVEDGKNTYVLYHKNAKDSDGKLYYNNLEDELKVDEDVRSYKYEGGKLYYAKYDEYEDVALYVLPLEKGGERVKIDHGVSEFVVHDNLLYYTKYDSDYDEIALYSKEFGKEKKKIDDGAIDNLIFISNGSFYYTKNNYEEMVLANVVIDDMYEEDLDVVEPDIEDYQYEEYIDSYWYFDGYYSTFTDYDAYYEDLELYYEKEARDIIREELEYYGLASGFNGDLYTVENGSRNLVCENIRDVSLVYEYNTPSTAGIHLLRAIVEDIEPVVNISELNDAYEVYDYLGDIYSAEYCVALGGKSLSVVQENTEIASPHSLYAQLQGSNLICLDYGNSDLYLSKISGGKAGRFEPIDHEVEFLEFINEDSFCYYKDSADNYNGDAYIYEKEKSRRLESDVYIGSLLFLDGNSDYIYISDYRKTGGTAYYVKKGKDRTRISDDVHDISFCNEEIYLLKDYNSKRMSFDLHRYAKGGRIDFIAEDVYEVVCR